RLGGGLAGPSPARLPGIAQTSLHARRGGPGWVIPPTGLLSPEPAEHLHGPADRSHARYHPEPRPGTLLAGRAGGVSPLILRPSSIRGLTPPARQSHLTGGPFVLISPPTSAALHKQQFGPRP